jgi:hypothetical protein
MSILHGGSLVTSASVNQQQWKAFIQQVLCLIKTKEGNNVLTKETLKNTDTQLQANPKLLFHQMDHSIVFQKPQLMKQQNY